MRVPQIIQNLGPTRILVSSDGYLNLKMHGGMDHFGVRIYPKDFTAADPAFFYGYRKLAEGLWYYDDAYLHNPGYDKLIDNVLHTGRWPTADTIRELKEADANGAGGN